MQDPEFDLEQLVTIETFTSPWEAQLARACLEAEGIEAVIADEHFFRLYGALSNSLGGVRLQVRPESAERAVELLRERRPLFYVVDEMEEAAEPATDREPEALVTVGRFYSPWEAHLARTLLESSGIDAVVCEERLPGVSLLTGEPTALSRLEVCASDSQRALTVLADALTEALAEENDAELPASES